MQGHSQVWRATHRGPKTLSRTTDANLDCGNRTCFRCSKCFVGLAPPPFRLPLVVLVSKPNVSDLPSGYVAVLCHSVTVRVCSVEQAPMLCRLHLNQPILRLRGHAHHSHQLCLPCHERVCRRSRVSLPQAFLSPILLNNFLCLNCLDCSENR